MSIIIGLGYRKRHGKDTAAAAIIRERGASYDVRRFTFADAIKREYVSACVEAGGAFQLISGMRVTHNLPDWVQFEFDSDKTDPICGEWGKQRTLLQWWGTEYRRAQDSLYWVRELAKSIDADKPEVALITDMRFKNEAAFVKMAGGYAVKVSRQGFVYNDDHISEHDLDDFPFDFELCGVDGQKEALEATAITWFDWLMRQTKTPAKVCREPREIQRAA